MFDRVNLDITFAERCRPLHGFHILDPGIDRRLVGQILAFKFPAVPRRRGMERQGHLFSRVKGAAADAGAFGEGLLERTHGRCQKEGGRYER